MTLKELIESMPGYVDASDPTDAAVLAWLKADTDAVGEIPSRRLIAWGAANGRISKLKDAAADVANTQSLRSVCEAAVLTITRADTALDMADPAHVVLVDTLVAAGIMSPADKAELVAMATTRRPAWKSADEWDYGAPGLGDVMQARAV